MPDDDWGSRWWRYGSTSQPIPVDDGIATTKMRGEMADEWWSKRFVQMLDTSGADGRMQRGRRYARTGQLVSFEVDAGEIRAQVQGSRSAAYVVTITARPATDEQWSGVDAVLASRVKFAARLMAGEVPRELEDVFDAAGASLLPRRWDELSAYCSCPDTANPCKHIAATLYVFADRLDGDPWLLLTWRGRTREQVLEPLLARVAHSGGAGLQANSQEEQARLAQRVAPWWPLDPAKSWTEVSVRPRDGVRVLSDVDPPDPPDGVLRRLRDLNTEVRGDPVTDRFGEVYRVVTAQDMGD